MRSFVDYHLYKIIYLVVCILIVFCIITFEHNVEHDRILAGKSSECTEEFTIKSIPKRNGDSVSFVAATGRKSKIRESVQVRINHAKNLDLCIGDNIVALGIYAVPERALNPGGFDYGDYLESIGASVCFDTDVSKIRSHSRSPLAPLYGLRQRIADKVAEYVSNGEAGIITALITGNKELISDSQAESYRRAGIYHIVAVSGLHLNLFVLFLSFAYASLTLSGRKKALLSLVVTLFACSFMLVFTGFGVSVTRAAFMAVILCAAPLVCREYSPFAGLFAVFALVLVAEPYYCKNISFCLSFSATAGILIGAHILKNHPPKRFKTITESFVLTICANIATIPFLVHYFGGVSLISPISNIVILAFCPFLLAFSYTFGSLSLFAGDFVCSVLGNMLSGAAFAVNCTSDFFAGLPYAYISCSIRDVALVYGAIACIALFAKAKNRALRLCTAGIFVIATAALVAYNVFAGYSAITFVNAGQGDCTLVRGKDRSTVMIDCGSEDAYDFASNEVVPFLRHKNIRKLDALFVTHFHTDHISGVCSLMDSGYVKTLILPERTLNDDEKYNAARIYNTAVANGVAIRHVSEGDEIKIGSSAVFTVLNPIDTQYPSANDASMVLKVECDGAKALLCGDIEEFSQYRLLDKNEKYDIIKVSHHGGKSTISKKFFDTFQCDYSVISCGVNNKYSHPHPDTLDALAGTHIMRTDKSGAPIEFVIKNNQIIAR